MPAHDHRKKFRNFNRLALLICTCNRLRATDPRGISLDAPTKQTGGSNMTGFSLRRRIFTSSGLVLTAVLLAGGAFAQDEPGAVYAMTNAAGGNSILIFARAANGTLTSAGSAATGGTGKGAGLGSQGALVVTNDQRWLLAVNAGTTLPCSRSLLKGFSGGASRPLEAQCRSVSPFMAVLYMC